MLRITRHRACIEVLFNSFVDVWRHCFDDVVGGLKYSMNQKSDGKSSKFGEKLMKKSSKSRSGGGLGRSWSDFGALGRGLAAFGLENLEKTQKKGEKRDLFGGFLGAFGALGRPSGGPGGHLGCILGVL